MLLIVERDPRFTAKLKKHLKISGLRNFHVESSRDALFLLKSMSAAFALVNLNALSDITELDELHAYLKGHQIPVLYIEGFQGTADMAAHLKTRAIPTMKLPFKIGELARRVESLRTDRDPLVGKRIGPTGQQVEILRKIGSGAMGTVYEGHQLSLDRHVAVKVLTKDINDPEATTRFLNEARAIARMRSTHIVQIIEVGTWENLSYYVMEFVNGPTLEKYLRGKKMLKINEALQLCRQILSGLAEAHGHGKIHRDLKPANIMLNPKGEPVILDFGLVRDNQDANVTRAGTVLGTPRYISPEQVTSTEVDHRADLYSLGILLFEMLIGRPPFEAATFEGVLLKHAREPFPRPEAFGKNLHPRVFAIIERLTMKDPRQRYPHAEEVIKEIDACLAAFSQDISMTTDSGFLAITQNLKPLGGLRIDREGKDTGHFGTVPEGREKTLLETHRLIEALGQLAGYGVFERGHFDTGSGRLLLFPSGTGLAALESGNNDSKTAFFRLDKDDLQRVFDPEAGT